MKKRSSIVTLAAAVVGSVLVSSPAFATFHLWEISEIFSNEDGTVQYIELFTSFNSQQFTAGTTIRASQGASSNNFVFGGNTPAPTAMHHLLIATADFASLAGAVTPDFTMDDGFLFTPDGVVNYLGANSMTYAVLPTNGTSALHCDANNGISCTMMSTGPNSPTNYAGATGSINVGGGKCVDNDNDGFGSPGDESCSGGSAEDCDDGDDTIFPGAPETPDDGIDQDCNGFDTVTCFEDNDEDGFGSSVVILADDGDCLDAGESANDTDCDDTDALINPGAAEVCVDDIDNDCDQLIDAEDPDCIPGGCGACQLHADVFPFTVGAPNANPVGNCVVDIDDILIILQAFSAENQCAPDFPDEVNTFPCDQSCEEGVIDIDCILAVLAAFSGTFGCDHPCPPGACCFGDSSCQDSDGLPPGTTPLGGMSETTCDDAGGVYQGDDTTCADVVCP